MQKEYYKNIFVSILVLATLSIAGFSVNAEDVTTQLQSQIESHSAEIERLNREIAQYQTELNSLNKQSNTLANQVKELDTTQKKLLTNLKLTQAKISQAEDDLVSLGGEIKNKEVTITHRGELIAENIRKLNESSQTTVLEMLLAEESFADAWTNVDQVKSFQDAVRSDVIELSNAKNILIDRHTDVEKKKEELLALKASLDDQKKIVDQNVKEKNDLLKATKNQESTYAKMVADRKALVVAFEAELRSYEEQLKYNLDPGSLPTIGSAPLGWPTSVPFITQQFGKTVDAVRLYASGSHSGVDFRAATGTPVYAMASGTVGGTGDTDLSCKGASFGKWILIRYDNNLASTYGHLSLIKVTNGQRVNRGDIVGYSGNTGHSTAPHLHVSLYPADAVEVSPKASLSCAGKTITQPRAAINAYLDPLMYMPKTTPSMFK